MMNYCILTKNYKEPQFNISEIFRYLGCKQTDKNMNALVFECIEEVRSNLSYRVCYTTTDVKIIDSTCDFDFLKVESKSLSKNLKNSNKAIVFAATIGSSIDRIILKYSHIMPSKAVIFQAIGAERIEALCNLFCEEVCHDCAPRFSPGYGDLSIEVQKDIFSLLNCSNRIGLTLNDSLIMSPTKSVTAFVGLYR